MSCRRVSVRQRQEQDYWLLYADTLTATEEERLEFLRYDSHGGTTPKGNPIYLGKVRHGITGAVLSDSYFAQDGSWIGGLELVKDYQRRRFGLRSLREWFGGAAVLRWLAAADEATA